jgi:predicted RNA polymerase sigma factor
MSHHAAEIAARDSYGRLLALVAARSRDIAAAEDALAEAFLAALQQWPREGVPRNPDAWLLTAARRRLTDGARRQQTRGEGADALALFATEEAESMDSYAFPDERLKLLFICAHPAIEESLRTPLMLQTVLGLDAALIANAMRVSPKTMGQRLWRAKTKIRDAGVAFEVPEQGELAERLHAVLEAIYAAYGSGWEDMTGDDPKLKGLTEEALWLGRLLATLLPEEPEPKGLLALMLYSEARRGTRLTPEGEYIPLSEQDASCWSVELIGEAERILMSAARLGRIGPYQLEAAIQSAHVERARTGRVNDQAVALLYEGLVQLSPTLGALVARAAAVANAQGAARGLELIEEIPEELREEYQPYWALRGHLLVQTRQYSEARLAYERALGMTEAPPIRQFLLCKLQALTH